jgi:hypothetical protein
MDNLWIDGPDDIANVKAHKQQSLEDCFVGCPVWWLQCVMPVVDSKEQLVVALYLWRRRVVCGNHKTFDVPNGELKTWGIGRGVKYRTLDLLATAGVIKINLPTRRRDVRMSKSKGRGKSATSITILVERRPNISSNRRAPAHL